MKLSLSKSNATINAPASGASGTASAGAITANADLCLITSESLSTAADASATIAVTNNKIVAGATVRANLVDYAGTFGTNGNPVVSIDAINTTNGTCNIVVTNCHSSNALSGAVKVLLEVVTLL